MALSDLKKGFEPDKIIRIITRLNIGGPAIHVVLLTEEMCSRGYSSLLVAGTTDPDEGDMAYLARERGVQVIHIPELVREFSPLKDVVCLTKLFFLLRRERPTIVHTHTAKAGTLGRLAAILAGVPLRIHTFHGNVFRGYFGRNLTTFYVWVERILSRFTHCIVALSPSQAHELADVYRIAPRERIRVIPLGLNLDSYRHNGEEIENRGRQASRDAKVRIAWVGRMVMVKDPNFFLEIAQVVSYRFPHVSFVMAGDGKLRTSVEKRAGELGIEERVTFTGWIRNMAEFYVSCDLLALTSHNEGTPVTLIEGMAAGLPFVATDVGGTRDLLVGERKALSESIIVFGNGILVKERDAGRFADALAVLISDPVRRWQMGQTGKSFVLQTFSKQRLADDLDSLYRSAAGDSTHIFGFHGPQQARKRNEDSNA